MVVIFETKGSDVFFLAGLLFTVFQSGDIDLPVFAVVRS